MAISQQRLESIKIQKLKSLQNMEMDLSENNLIAIMGVNGVGKSTILHALACCYRPTDGDTQRRDYKFSEFFLPNTYALWNDSSFSITYSFRDGNREYPHIERTYQKNERWSPRYSSRPQRYVSYIGIDSCVPVIESDTTTTFVPLTRREQNDNISEKILDACKYILDIPYSELAICKNPKGKQYLGVTRERVGEYTSLSMGAGEQRIFKIISEVLKCPKYSLILIDEIELLLHVNALKRLIKKLKSISDEKKLQVIFTTHSMIMNELNDYVKIRYLVQTPNATLVQTAVSTDSILHLTGDAVRPVQLYVEDKLSETIINQLCSQMNCKRMVKVFRFGPAINSFTVIAGKVLNHDLDENTTAAIIDGDVYKTEQEKINRIKQVVTGQHFEAERTQVLRSILQYQLPDNSRPEAFIRSAILSLDEDVLPWNSELRLVLNEIGVVDDDHNYIDDAIRRLDLGYDVGLSRVVELFSKTTQWNDFVLPIRQWLTNAIQNI